MFNTKKVMFRWLLVGIGLLIGLTFSLILTEKVQADSSKIEELYKAAKNEGKVIFHSPDDVPTIRKLYKQFKKKFPGIKLEHLEIRPGEIAQRIITENKLGRCSVDVGSGTGAQMSPLLDRDLVAKYTWEIFDILSSQVSFEGRGLITSTDPYVIVYNTNLVGNPNKFPKKTKDLLEYLLDPQWKGKILIERRGWMFARLATTVFGDEWMTDYLKKLRAQKLIFSKGTGTTGNMIAAGEAHIGIPHYLYKTNTIRAKGAPIDWFRINPIACYVPCVYVPKAAPHPNAARLWAGWFASQEGRKLHEDIDMSGLALPGSVTKTATVFKQNGIEAVYEKSLKEFSKSYKNQKKYAKILEGR